MLCAAATRDSLNSEKFAVFERTPITSKAVTRWRAFSDSCSRGFVVFRSGRFTGSLVHFLIAKHDHTKGNFVLISSGRWMNMSFKLFDLCNVFIYFLSTTDDVLILNSFAILFVISDAFILSLRATVFKLVNAAGHDSLLAEVVLVPPIETHSISGSARLKSQTISRWEN